jgi:hypothetical protein
VSCDADHRGSKECVAGAAEEEGMRLSLSEAARESLVAKRVRRALDNEIVKNGPITTVLAGGATKEIVKALRRKP